MRINLTKKDLVNLVYMQIGFSKQISENLIEEYFSLIVSNLIFLTSWLFFPLSLAARGKINRQY